MQIRICDRCRAEVVDTPARTFVRGVTVSPDLPSTDPVSDPGTVNLSITVQTPADLCPPCRLSAMAEYIAQEIVATKSADIIKTLGARIVKVLKGLA